MPSRNWNLPIPLGSPHALITVIHKMNHNKVLFAISPALVGSHLFTAPLLLTWQGMQQTFFFFLQTTAGEGGGVQQHQGVSMRYQKTGEK